MTSWRLVMSMSIPPQMSFVSGIIKSAVENKLKNSGKPYTFKSIGGIFVYSTTCSDEEKADLEAMRESKEFKRLRSLGGSVEYDFVEEKIAREVEAASNEGE